MKPFRSWYCPLHVESGQRFTNQWSPGSKFFYRNYREKWWKALGFVVRQAPKEWDKNMRHTLELIRVMRPKKHAMDPENYAQGCKPIPDYFRRAAWIRDDSLKWLNRIYTQVIWKEAQAQGYTKPGTYINFWKGDNDDED